MQHRNLHERLRYQHKPIEVECDHGRDHVGPPPSTFDILAVERDHRDCEDYQRDGSDDVRWQHVLDREQISREARQHCR